MEYSDNHQSPSVYVKFPITSINSSLSSTVTPFSQNLHLVIWTTTPWTLPANLAVCVHSKILYCVVPNKNGSEYFVIAKERVKFLENLLNLDTQNIKCEFHGDLLEKSQYSTPFGNKIGVVLVGDHVTLDTGTGLVHTAPGHGFEDFLVCQNFNIPPISVGINPIHFS